MTDQNEKKLEEEIVEEKCPLLFDISKPGRRSFVLPKLDVPKADVSSLIPKKFLRKEKANLPEVNNLQLVRHFTALSKRNTGLDDVFYPLGSCTMKYNPRINEKTSSFPGLSKLHPYQPENSAQGMIEIFYTLQQYLEEISGLSQVSLAPAAGAHGELTSLMTIKAYHRAKGQERKYVLIPDSGHGTNPASCTLCGYKVKTIKSNCDGNICMDDLESKLTDEVAALMITNPNTLGLFEKKIMEVTQKAHEVDALVYMDGANMNALLGITRPGDFGIDVMHFNLHKTFSTPHGGGGPGAGPIAVSESLQPFLPGPIAYKKEDGSYAFKYMQSSLGRTRGFYGNAGIVVRAYTYIRTLGREGLKNVTKMAILNANYLKCILQKYYELPYDQICMHEFVLSANKQKKQKVRALDIAKRLLDFKFHPPTVYFPLIVPEAMMIEPTETEAKETLDAFARAMIKIDKEANEEPWTVQEAPYFMSVTRLDEVGAARNPILRWYPPISKEK